jgi:hypothetical protein
MKNKGFMTMEDVDHWSQIIRKARTRINEMELRKDEIKDVMVSLKETISQNFKGKVNTKRTCPFRWNILMNQRSAYSDYRSCAKCKCKKQYVPSKGYAMCDARGTLLKG